MAMQRTSDAIYEEWLVLRCQDGDASAFEELVARWQPRLVRHAQRLTGRPDAAGDVMQEAWLGIVRGIGRLNDPAGFRAWAYRIVSHKCADWVRARRRTRNAQIELNRRAASSDQGDGGHGYMRADGGTAGASGDEIAVLKAAIEKLPAEHRAVITLHYLEGMSVAEIATSLEVPAGTVKSRLHHARNRLKQSLERTE